MAGRPVPRWWRKIVIRWITVLTNVFLKSMYKHRQQSVPYELTTSSLCSWSSAAVHGSTRVMSVDADAPGEWHPLAVPHMGLTAPTPRTSPSTPGGTSSWGRWRRTPAAVASSGRPRTSNVRSPPAPPHRPTGRTRAAPGGQTRHCLLVLVYGL